MTTGAVATEVHPFEFVTVNEYDPVTSPVIVTDEVEPAMFPGFIVQFPAGRPLRGTLPVATVHDGWVIVPTTGVTGTGLTVTVVVADCAL